MPSQITPPEEIAQLMDEVRSMSSTDAVFHMAKELVDCRESLRKQDAVVVRLLTEIEHLTQSEMKLVDLALGHLNED